MSLTWDPEIDTPATIAILGGGPCAIEASLYARFLGYDVMLFDNAKVGDELLAWGDRTLLYDSDKTLGWNDVTSPLGLAALAAQGSELKISELPDDMTYRQYVEQYLLPLARTDLLYDSIQIHSPVLSISRISCNDDDPAQLERRAEQEFRLLIDSRKRGEYSQLADIVIDCRSTQDMRSGLASGRGLAIGERASAAQLLCGKQDIIGKSRSRFANRRTVLIGSDVTACAMAVEFMRLAETSPLSRLTWIIPKRLGLAGCVLDVQSLQASEGSATWQVIQDADELRDGEIRPVVPMAAWGVEELSFQDAVWSIKLQTSEEETLDVTADELINCCRPTPSSSTRPIWNLNLSLLKDLPAMTATEPEHDARLPAFFTGEPHYYNLGTSLASLAQSGPTTEYLAAVQPLVRDLFARIGGRSDLNLYNSIKPPQ